MIRAIVKTFLILSFLTGLGSPASAQVNAQKSVNQIYADIDKINKSIEATREKVKTVKDARFLPDLYFVLAELHVEKSRFMYAVKRLQNKDVPANEIDFTNEKRPKQQAIEIYGNILDKFPMSPDRDKALFYMAHEYRELGQLEEMAKTYLRLTREFPRSNYWAESQLIIANFYFEEKKDFESAVRLYKLIIDRPVGPFTPLARYKLGWVYINQNKFKESLLSFESVVLQDDKLDLSQLPEIYRKTDVRRDAVTAMVWPYSEIKPEELAQMGAWRVDPIKYFYRLSTNKITYQKALKNLGRRLSFKHRYIWATRVYFELLRVTEELESRQEAIEKIYESMKNTQNRWPINYYVDEIVRTLPRIANSPEIKPKDKEKIINNYEVFARDVATRFHERAQETKRKTDYQLAIRAYESYLIGFPNSRQADAIRLNMAEAHFKISDFVEAAKAYEVLSKSKAMAGKRKPYLDSSLQSFITALKSPDKLSKLNLVEARNGMREVGGVYIKEFPTDKALPSIRFNIGRTFYDERNFEGAVKAFQSFIKAFPTHSDVQLASDLILDSFNQKEDYAGLAKAGRLLMADTRIKADIRKNIEEIVKQAEYKRIQAKAGDYSSPSYTKNLLKFAQQYKGSQIGDQALYEAFLALKSKRDPGAYQPGEQLLIQHENSKYAKEVVAAMGQMALVTADYRRVAAYFEAYSRKYPADTESKTMLKSAANMREYMGDFSEGKINYRSLGDAESAARMDFLSERWDQLVSSAASVPGLKGPYWVGLAKYRMGDVAGASGALRQVANSRGGGFEENTMSAHALYLLASEALKSYASIQMEAGKEAQAVQAKTKMLGVLTEQLNTVIKFGNGRWTIAALYGLGRANQEFAEFVKRAPIPPGLSGAQVAQYQGLISKQASGYEVSAKKFFSQCVQTAEKFEVFTQFVKGCLSNGSLQIDESKESRISAKASDTSPQAAQGIRKQLYDKPRDVKLLVELSRAYTQNQDYSMAVLILSRASEIAPQDASLISAQGMNYLFMNDLESAQRSFQKALKMNGKDSGALWGLAGLYKEFKYGKKLAEIQKRARSAGRPAQPLHPYVQAVL